LIFTQSTVHNENIITFTKIQKKITISNFKVNKWEQEKSSIFQNNIDIDKLNFIISKLENVDSTERESKLY
jgi:hypothetical protein